LACQSAPLYDPLMTEAEIAKLASWLAKAGLEGRSETALVEGFCSRAAAGGLPLARAMVLVDTLHPIHEGRAFRWEREKPEATLTEYGRTTEGEAAERWRTSPLYRLSSSSESLLRLRVNAETEAEFPSFAEFREAKFTDYVAIINRFAEDGMIGEMDCVYSYWTTDRAEGFSDDELGALKRLTPFLGLAIKAASLARIAETLVETYLGRDAGRRVLRGRIERGVADRINTVLWFSDLRNYTRISDTSPPEEIIPLLNDYAEAIVSSIHEHSGDVLKLIGDGVLAIFPAEERSHACAAALDAAGAARQAVAALNARRSEKGLPSTEMYLGLHFGEVFYGNIGSKERLDFTVVGPAVNEVSRIAAMCRSVDQPILLSSAFAETCAEQRHAFASVGRFALRGVGRPQELFTLDLLETPSPVSAVDCARPQETAGAGGEIP
jgi:adenylate cyclase